MAFSSIAWPSTKHSHHVYACCARASVPLFDQKTWHATYDVPSKPRVIWCKMCKSDLTTCHTTATWKTSISIGRVFGLCPTSLLLVAFTFALRASGWPQLVGAITLGWGGHEKILMKARSWTLCQRQRREQKKCKTVLEAEFMDWISLGYLLYVEK